MKKTISRTYAVISDIHGNSDALKAVLADIDALGIESIVNLGDHVSGPMAARETAEILMARDIVNIRGNHDRWVADSPAEKLGPSDRVARDELRAPHLEWLRAMPATRSLDGEIFLCHGTPSSDTTYWLESVGEDGSISLRDRDRIEAEAVGLDHPLILCGHTHVPRLVRLRDGRLLLNPGSVGCPGYTDDDPVPHIMQNGTPDACYAVVEPRGHGIAVTHRHVPYDSSRMVALALERARPEWASAVGSGWIA